MNDREYLTLDEAGDSLAINRATVYRWAQRLRIKPRHFIGSKKTFLAAEDVERIREAQSKPWLAGERPEETLV